MFIYLGVCHLSYNFFFYWKIPIFRVYLKSFEYFKHWKHARGIQSQHELTLFKIAQRLRSHSVKCLNWLRKSEEFEMSSAEKFQKSLKTVESFFSTIHQNIFDPDPPMSVGFVGLVLILLLFLAGLFYTVVNYERNSAYFALMMFIGTWQVKFS